MPQVDRDQSDQAVALGRTKLDKGDLVGARRFAQKALALDPTSDRARGFGREVEAKESGREGQSSSSSGAAGMNGNGHAGPHAGLRHRREVKTEDESHGRSSGATYTKEQVEVVKRVTKHGATAYYSILEIERSASEADIKRAYRKLALLLHPDKNRAPGATEAFKLVSKAFTVLADSDKRSAYDRYGGDPDSRQSAAGAAAAAAGGGAFSGMSGRGPSMRFGGSQEVSPEDLFNAFFGGGQGFGPMGSPFGGASFSFGGGPGIRFQQFGGPTRRSAGGSSARAGSSHGEQQAPVWTSLAPVIFFILFSLLSMIVSSEGGFSNLNPWSTFVAEPAFALYPTREFSATRLTSPPIEAKYYVNSKAFETWHNSESVQRDVAKKMHLYERKIEGSYLRALRAQCEREKEGQQRDLQDEFGLFGIGVDRAKVKKIQTRHLANCERLQSLNARFYQ